MGQVYIILSRSNTVLARFIRLVTKKYYNHASLSFERSLDTFYSFGRLNPRLMFPAGFITEGVRSGYFGLHPKTKIMVLERDLPDEDIEVAKDNLLPFINRERRFKYGIWHFPNIYRGKTYRDDRNYVCSVFVAYVMKHAFDYGKDYSLVMPEDFHKLGANVIYEGNRGDYDLR